MSGLRRIEQREKREAAQLEALREVARTGFADLHEGRFIDFSSFDELDDHLTRMTEEALASRRR